MTIPTPHFPQILRNTLMKDWKSCQHKTHLTWFFGYRRDDGVDELNQTLSPHINTHLHAGAAFAKGCEVTRTLFFRQNKSANESIAAGVKALLKFYGHHNPVPIAPYKSANNMAAGLVYFFTEAFPLEGEYIIPVTPSGASGIEFQIALPIPRRDGKGYYLHPETGEDLIYTGRADQIGFDTRDEVHVIEDDKTTSRLGETWTKQWDKESQFRSYAWATREYGYPPIHHAAIRGIALPSSARGKFGHEERILYLPERTINLWLLNTQLIVEEMLRSWATNEYTLALDSRCAWGNCPFFLNCEDPLIELHRELTRQYKVENADVLEEQDETESIEW